MIEKYYVSKSINEARRPKNPRTQFLKIKNVLGRFAKGNKLTLDNVTSEKQFKTVSVSFDFNGHLTDIMYNSASVKVEFAERMNEYHIYIQSKTTTMVMRTEFDKINKIETEKDHLLIEFSIENGICFIDAQ